MISEIISANFELSGIASHAFNYEKTDDISFDQNGKLHLSNWGYNKKYKINCSINIKQRKFEKFIFYYYNNINVYGGYPQGETRDSLYIENLPFELDENDNLIVDISNADIDSSYYPMYYIHDYYYLEDAKATVEKSYYKLEDLKNQNFFLTFKLYHDKTLDIMEAIINDFEIYPNPATDHITINLAGIIRGVNLSVEEKVAVEIYDIMGVKLNSSLIVTNTSTTLNNSFVSLQQKLDISNLIPGIYFVKIFGCNGSCSNVQKFVKY